MIVRGLGLPLSGLLLPLSGPFLPVGVIIITLPAASAAGAARRGLGEWFGTHIDTHTTQSTRGLGATGPGRPQGAASTVLNVSPL